MKKIAVLMQKMPIPTARTAWLVALGMAAAALWGWKGAVGIDLGILFFCGMDFAFILKGRDIRPVRICPHQFSHRVSQDLEIFLKNGGGQTLRVHVRDQTPSGWAAAPILKGLISGRSELKLHYSVTPPRRGIFTFGDISLRIEGPLGLVIRSCCVPASEEIAVYPGLDPLRYSDLATYRRKSRQWGLRSIKWRGEGRDFESLREYMEGDDPRKIHWKASARRDRPIVQEFQPERNQIVMILLDAGRLMSAVSEGKNKLDHALEAAIRLTQTALSGGDQTGVLAFADRVISFVPPKRTPEQLRMILEGTLSIQPSFVESQYEEAFLLLRARVRRRSLVVIFTDILDESASENLLEAVALLRPRHLPMCVAIRESEWDDMMKRPPSNLQEVYERSVLQESLRQRSRALRGLLQKGALAMDLPPARLFPGTLQRYCEVKQRGLL